ncbi:hypothetical protein [Planobispora longispora]|uniref:Uncharacterized protein n=1 Tax=Planobispora longispora TaxID=28887 RepID=A0A8J3RT13_9ACTN|nr:hypothetical protein [Planobispora longispora]BFE81978.1 hypothetical protein GCM10020093_045790 [Planobispora longispora]GIH79347.1 hypothetical protein Plo01_57760 [Planobispora longispora]
MSERKSFGQMSWAELKRMSWAEFRQAGGWAELGRMNRADLIQLDMLPAWYATRERRRWLAGAGIFALALQWINAAVSWAVGPDDGGSRIILILVAIMMVIYLPAVTLMNIATRGLVELAERHLDERQVGERLRATTIAHRITTGLLTACFAAAVVAGMGGGDDYVVPERAVVMLVIALALTHFVLPLIVSTWRLPDPLPDNEE